MLYVNVPYIRADPVLRRLPDALSLVLLQGGPADQGAHHREHYLAVIILTQSSRWMVPGNQQEEEEWSRPQLAGFGLGRTVWGKTAQLGTQQFFSIVKTTMRHTT